MIFMPIFSYKMLWRALTRGLPTRLMTGHLLIQFCLVLPLLCGNLPHSAYYFGDYSNHNNRHSNSNSNNNNDNNKATMQESIESRVFLDSLANGRWKYNPSNAMGANLTIGLLTSTLDGSGSLSRSAYALLSSADSAAANKIVGQSGFASLKVYICSEDGLVDNYLAVWGTALPVLGPRPTDQLNNLGSSNRARSSKQSGGKTDNLSLFQSQLWCLSALSTADPFTSWLAVIPDSYLARKYAVSKIGQLIHHQTQSEDFKQSSSSSSLIVLYQSDWEMLRYFPPSISSLVELICLTALLAALPCLIYYRKFFRRNSPMSNGGLAGFLVLQALLTVLAVGRPNWRWLAAHLAGDGNSGNSPQTEYGLIKPLDSVDSNNLFLFDAPLMTRRSSLTGLLAALAGVGDHDSVAIVTALTRAGHGVLVTGLQLFDPLVV